MKGEGTTLATLGCTSQLLSVLKILKHDITLSRVFCLKPDSFADVTSTKFPWINIAATGRLWSMMEI